MSDTYHWLDVERIGEELADAHPDLDPLHLPFPKLRILVEDLEGFTPQPGHPVNERILEAIQQAWLDELDSIPGADDDDDR
ncbi:MAG: Fe-S cluster assembly protein IscX [Planctomycetota bacterium]|nr:Fe-S cluster assembly protein IscX [Planctomycetota bacterium]